MAEKWTPDQKRGVMRKNAEKYADRRVKLPVDRTPQELMDVQMTLAVLALKQENPEAWLRDALDSLGLHKRFYTIRKNLICVPYTGTKRGLDRHMKIYENPCPPCADVRKRQRDDRLAQLGLTHEGVIE